MEKENGDGSDATGKGPNDGLLDAAGLFGAYWGRDGGGAMAQAQAQAALFGFGGRYPPPATLGAAASQAASLGMHNATSAAWWSMASHIAAQDYLARLQASGMSFPPMGDPYSALSALGAGGGGGGGGGGKKSNKSKGGESSRSGRSSASSQDKDKRQSNNMVSPNMRTSYGFPKTSSPSPHPPTSSLASLNSLVASQKKAGGSHSRSSSKPSSSARGGGASSQELAMLRGDLMLQQYRAMQQQSKNMSSLYPFGVGSDKDRHVLDGLGGIPHTILSDPGAVLGGVRLPPDTEIIKYTSSLMGPKAPAGGGSRGRKKTISLDPPQVSVHPAAERAAMPSKRQKVDEYGASRSSVEVIRLPARDRPAPATPPPNLADYAGISRELLQTIASQSGVSLAALEKQLAGSAAGDGGLNLSTKAESPLDLGPKASGGDEDAPLNLSLKPVPASAPASDALSRLTSLSSSLTGNVDRSSRRKPGAKPRRVPPEPEEARPKSSGSEDSESVSSWPSREGRPRNLGRGVSKPKKNTVASLLAQSRALGLRPALAQQLLAETDLEKLKALLGEAASVSGDSECPTDTSDSDAGDNEAQCRQPLAMGWKRLTTIRGLTRGCHIRGDVQYAPPEPHRAVAIRSAQDLHAFLEAHPHPPLTAANFSFSPRLLVGEYLQPEPAEPRLLSEGEIAQRLEEARTLAALTVRPTPPPVDRRIELARRQQAARDARRDATSRSRDQNRLVRELEKTERAEYVKREKEVRSQQILQQINKGRTQLTIEPVLRDNWPAPDSGPKKRHIPPISLSLIPVSAKDNAPIKTINLDEKNWRNEVTADYNALDKIKDFTNTFDGAKFDFSLTKSKDNSANSLDKLLESYSRLNEFINGCDWSKDKVKKVTDPKKLEEKYLDAKNDFMSKQLNLQAKDNHKSILRDVVDLRDDQDSILNDIISKKSNEGTFSVGKDGALSISIHSATKEQLAKRKRFEENEKQKIEDQNKRQQERELKRQQAAILKEQQKYISEERERRRQHTSLIRQLELRRRWEDRERRKHRTLLDRLLAKEGKLRQRRKQMELLAELRRPREDSTLPGAPLPPAPRVPGLALPPAATAHLLQTYEFLHNFGHALGFDPENLPTLNTFQQALLHASDEAEEKVTQVLTQLLLCAIEDPGIPHPGRHTTLLGHAIRMGDICPANVSEVLRIYLYANATGEVKAATGLSAERERERRIPDHHQTASEMLSTAVSSKNHLYYEHLHKNTTYKLSEALREYPFSALSASTKAHILAYLCDELLQNKAVLRQIDSSLENYNQLKKERYLMDMKIRKLRSLLQRKTRAQNTEKQQALALERMQRLVEGHSGDGEPQDEKPDQSERDKTPQPEGEKETNSPLSKDAESDKESSPVKDLKVKEMINNNKGDCSPADAKDKDSVMGDEALSDLESEGTQPEEDEDKNLSSEELSRKLEKLLRQSETQLQQLSAGSHSLRATCYGQDRYWRRYWTLGECGGVFVEGMQTAQPEIVDYHRRLEARARREKDEPLSSPSDDEMETEDALKSEMELKSIKSELNLSDHTSIIKYEPNMKHGAHQNQGASIKMHEKYIQQQAAGGPETLDIEDSIPTAFLVPKPTHEARKETEEPEEPKDELVNNLEELRKMAEAVSSQLEAEKAAEEEAKQQKQKIKEEEQIKNEAQELDDAETALSTKTLEGKWFSILRHETSFLSETDEKRRYRDNEQTCNEVVMCQGHKWDVTNNLHLLNDPSLFTLNSMVTSVQVPVNNVYADSSLTMSGLEQNVLDSVGKDSEDVKEEEDNDLEKEIQADAKSEALQRSKALNLQSLGLLNFNALSTYVTCDSPPPIQMTAEEAAQLEMCKVNGLPKKVEGSFVPKDLRQGWWRITEPEGLRALMDALQPRGVRERELALALAQVPVVNNKLHVERGDAAATRLEPAAAQPDAHSDAERRRVNLRLLQRVEQLEERIAAASMQVKGWRPSRLPLPEDATAAEVIARAVHKLAAAEAHIERRYLKPPFVQSTSEAAASAVLAGEQGNSAASPQQADSAETKEPKGISRGLATWRDALSRVATAAQAAQALHALEAATAWDKSIMKANCQFCLSGDNEDQLLLCDGCDKGYHTYCFKPRIHHIPEGDWYCWECVASARGERVCVVCGGARPRVLCALCVRAYHAECHRPPLRNPRGKWYCSNCVSKAPPKKPRHVKKRESKTKETDEGMVPSPAPSHASTSTAEEAAALTPEKAADERADDVENGVVHPAPPDFDSAPATPERARPPPSTPATPATPATPTAPATPATPERGRPERASGNGAVDHDAAPNNVDGDEAEERAPLARGKKDKGAAKRLAKELQMCKSLLADMECHEHAWPFLLPVNTKQFPQYRKVIKSPMDLATVKRRVADNTYKSKEDFATDVRLIFSNCEVFNEDDSPVGRAGHFMRQFFEERWTAI